MQQDHSRLGYWMVDSDAFYSKPEAVYMASSRHTRDVRYIFHDDVYSLLDWTQEPEASLADLYRARAQQLRDSYDYLVLMYSGGSDSSNALKSFLYNDIKLDEVVYFWVGGPGEDDNPVNMELRYAASAMLKKCRDQYNIPVRRIDMTEYQEVFHLDPHTWIFDKGDACLNGTGATRIEMMKNIKDWRKITDQGHSLGTVFGFEKPRIYTESARWYSGFLDCSVNTINKDVVLNKTNFRLEPFYTTPDLPEIVVKQSHVVKKYITSTYDPEFCAENFQIDRFNRQLYFKIVRNTIYPTWNDQTYSRGKSHPVYPEKDLWYCCSNTEFSENYWSGFHWIDQHVDPYWFHNTSVFDQGLLGCFSRKYWLDV
jgi:hypothetical protein